MREASNFYNRMGIFLLLIIIAGFGSTAAILGRSPLELPVLFHMHGIIYLIWYGLFITQTSLITKGNTSLHKTLGQLSPVVVVGMLVTGLMMSAFSFERGTSPIPDTTIQQFMAFPLCDLVGLTIFYSLGILNRSNALTHKHCMLIASIAIMDPGVARLAFAIGIPPLAILMHLGLVVIVMIYDRKSTGSIHMITWAGLAYVIFRIVFIFTVGATEGWANLMNSMYG